MGNIDGLKVKKKDDKQYIGFREVVDSATGELLNTHPIFKTKQGKINYVMVFLENTNIYEVLGGLGSSGKVLGFILKEYNDKDNMFYFSTSNKERMVKELSLSIGTIRAAVKQFNETGILCHVRGAEYMLNPSVFFKGGLERVPDMVKRFEEFVSDRALKQATKHSQLQS